LTTTPPTPKPVELVLHQKSRTLEVVFDEGSVFRIPYELMRVYSPSAEVQGHGPGQEVLQAGKRAVGVLSMAAVGHYGVQPVFTDGHDSGIFTWELLWRLGSQQDTLMRDYEARLAQAGLSREASS
jgi:DUF971 family protein